eukprot:scaffold5169_cov172-Amphora_coffeaeformis.AAC.21
MFLIGYSKRPPSHFLGAVKVARHCLSVIRLWPLDPGSGLKKNMGVEEFATRPSSYKTAHAAGAPQCVYSRILDY